jgi:hypothetical protein
MQFAKNKTQPRPEHFSISCKTQPSAMHYPNGILFAAQFNT